MLDKNIEKIEIVNQYLVKHKDEFNKDIGGIIKDIRTSKKISIEEFSNMVSTSSSYVCQIEHGNNGLSLIKFLLICNALKEKPNHFLNSFLYYDDDNEDILFRELQKGKNISRNLINYMKNKY
jgi:transcriptional regulator with XRE-family HTH domain